MTHLLTPFVDYLGAHEYLSILVAFLAAFCEALLIVGLFVPSTVILVGIGALIGAGALPLWPVLTASVIGAAAGDALSFWLGIHLKDHIRDIWPFSRYGALLDRGEDFVRVHGGKSIFLARFIPGVKAVVPTIAGAMGMNPARFALVNVVSALVWSAAHLLPAIILGRGLQVAHAANPRFVLLAAIAGAAVVLGWVAVRLTRLVFIPLADRARIVLAAWLDRQGRRGGVLARFLRNHDRRLEAAALLGVAIAGLAGFATLLLAVLFDPQLALADAAISQFAQGLRTDWATRAMIGLTMTGDTAVLLPIAVLLVAVLAFHRQGVLAATVSAAMVAGTAFVPLFKAIVQRPRPLAMYQGTDGFSFPSGHATLAAIILGILALFVAVTVPERHRGRVFAAFAGLIVLIAFSRVFLQAHWPSDVLAGMSLGGAVVAGVALVLHVQRVRVPRRGIVALLAVAFLGVLPLHLVTGWSAAVARYDAAPVPESLTVGDWLAGGWQNAPTHRILLDGDPGEPILVQTDLPLAQLTGALVSGGWEDRSTGLSAEILAAWMPSRAPLAARQPWPMTHVGRAPLATLTQPVAGDQRRVLRVWPTDTQVRDAAGDAPLLLISVTTEGLDPLASGFAQIEGRATLDADQATVLAELAGILAPGSAQDETPPLRITR